ncbi:MAG: 16S rRNA (adenine(1518)-N(6)/adenine(1519)-N(6))-dimethyltransferase RsmA [Bacteroidales bacterium]|nr:16S rRNA (adenine(1518)-N(6)/adenine(1519)-N(6))-dimethyltransferase RsmA [Bacteroidales bacterium]
MSNNYNRHGEVRAKKSLGQHFLKDMQIAQDIAAAALETGAKSNLLEIGPGMGVLTQFLINQPDVNLKVVEIDGESVEYLRKKFGFTEENLIEGDFLKLDMQSIFGEPFAIVGNFPYNISSQILFKAIENRQLIRALTGMYQKEVARRVVSPPGSKEYGIISVFCQAWYRCEYLFTVDEHVFTPPPKVKSGVIRLIRNEVEDLGCNEKHFIRTVKAAFNQRRKTLRNAISGLDFDHNEHSLALLGKRAEQLGVEEFVLLASRIIEKSE